VEQGRIVIVSDDPEFVNMLVQSWQRAQYAPEFTLLRCGCVGPAECVAAVTDGSEALAGLRGEVLRAVVVTVADEPLPKAGALVRRVVRVRRSEGWAEVAAALAQETMLHAEALRRVAEAENLQRELERFAVLGRFISEQRHGLGNALTSVLGHSELLLMGSGQELHGEVREQLEAIHTMSLKMLETVQSLSLLDMEMGKNRGASC
jgi:signal transduction histidine kinase